MTTKEAVDHLVGELDSDAGYYNAWQANIAVAFYDTVKNAGYDFPELHALANKAAVQFLTILSRPQEGQDATGN